MDIAAAPLIGDKYFKKVYELRCLNGVLAQTR